MAFTLQSGLAAEPGGTLKLAFSAKEGSLIYDESGLRLSLAKKIGAGGEGEVFKLHDGRVCKIFRPVRVTQAVIAKLKLMVEHGAPKGAAVCWPESLAVSNGLQPEWLGGYIMPAAEGIPLQQRLEQEEGAAFLVLLLPMMVKGTVPAEQLAVVVLAREFRSPLEDFPCLFAKVLLPILLFALLRQTKKLPPAQVPHKKAQPLLKFSFFRKAREHF